MDEIRKNRENSQAAQEPPAFSPPPEMRAAYLRRRRDELDVMLLCARQGDWRSVAITANHVRGTGAMYGFANIGEAAENLAKAVQNGAGNCLELVESYIGTVNESYT